MKFDCCVMVMHAPGWYQHHGRKSANSRATLLLRGIVTVRVQYEQVPRIVKQNR
jgi:hypothetical protein